MATKLPILSIHRPKTELDYWGHDRIVKPPRPTKENPLIISASELKTFLRCRLKWFWRHQIRIESKEKALPLRFGGYAHGIIEPWYDLPEAERTVKAMRRIAKRKTNAIPPEPEGLKVEDIELMQSMMKGYAAFAIPKDRELKLKNIETEKFFELPLVEDGSILVRGYLDVCFQIGSLKKTMGCFEHKTAASIRRGAVDTNIQLSIYLWALRWLYPNAKRYISFRNTLRKQMPGPRVTAPLFDREPIERTDDEIDQWAIDVSRAARDMLDAAIYPNPMDACDWDCDYRLPCVMRGGDPADFQHVIDTNFKVKESRRG
jgi:hypothetical protein